MQSHLCGARAIKEVIFAIELVAISIREDDIAHRILCTTFMAAKTRAHANRTFRAVEKSDRDDG